ncbi:DUF2125 domain-containing protein [Halocynthiibacter sp. C4]|uniref:DUF2125 domain-containing protein n=1 Tax=Halocynthiibacter sp. C4 TaxID=2992758 RepID=UPI00237BEFA1|nr:DUF2125 domain-containing protein [Halocynthiibacter sp. C4]MDE0590305.1 DUF2125 domain-containing protein [Halocynthiibacter sp. C4]
MIALFVLWGGYWFVGSSAVESNAAKLIEQAREDGATFEYSNLNTRGFPSRFDTTIENINAVTPDQRIAWKAPFFQLFALSYRPNHLIAVWPNEQELRLDGTTYNIGTERLRASLVVEANKSLALDRFQLSGESIKIASDAQGHLTAAGISLASEQVQDSFDHHIGLRLNGVDLRAPNQAPLAIQEIFADATLGFDAPISYTTQVNPTSLTLHKAELKMGTSLLRIEGDLTLDSLGYADGALLVTAQNWQPLYDEAKARGLLDPEFEEPLRDILTNLASTESPETDFTAPLTVTQGTIKFGFVTLGYLPPLQLYLQ